MITCLIRTKGPDGSRTVHGVVHLEYDPVSMDVAASRTDPATPAALVGERLPLLSCVRNLKRLHGLPAREVLGHLRSAKGRVLEIDPVVPLRRRGPDQEAGPA